MPIYEYYCERCNKIDEVLKFPGEADEAACLICGGAMKKLMSVPFHIYKGSGFYATDYQKKTGTPDKSGKKK